MSYTAEELLKLASNYDSLATKALVVEAKKKENKKLDPKAKVRNRGTVCVPAEQAKDKKDHFPINDEGQARNALARVHQYSSAPEWYKGSLKGLQDLVSRKVKAKYPKIDVGGKKEKKSSLIAELVSFAEEVESSSFLESKAQGAVKDQDYAKNQTASRIQSINAVNSRNDLTPDQVKDYVNGYMTQAYNDFMGNIISQEQYSQIVQAGQQKMFGTDNRQGPTPINWNQPQQQQQQGTITIPTVQMVSKKPTPVREDVRKMQQRLNSMIMSGAINAHPLDPDGKMGPLTREVMRVYKTDYLKVPHMEDEQVIKALSQDPPNAQQPSGGIVRESPF